MNRPRGTCLSRPTSRSGAPSEATGATALAAGPCRPRTTRAAVRSTIPKRGPPPACPKKVDYKKPQMTKAMMQRLKHTEKFREEIERKEREREEATRTRRPKRSGAPPASSACEARMRRPPEGARCPRPKSRDGPACGPTRETTAQAQRMPSSRPCSRAATTTACPTACPAAASTRGKGVNQPSGAATVPTRTRNLAASMNADIVQAEPLQVGPIDNVIIPPGTINSERTTIVSIPQQPTAELACSAMQSSTMASAANCSAANRSVQIISETLDEQDATESAVVNSKLQDLQQARRDFVMAVANVGGNAINLQEDELANVTPISDVTPPYLGSPEPPSPRLHRCPSIDTSYFTPEYSIDDPGAEARRQYLRERGKYVDPFAQLARQAAPAEDDDELIEPPEGLPPGLFDADDDACCQGPATFALPRRAPYDYLPCDVERVERFFDLEHFPPQQCPRAPPSPGPPPGRECLPSDLWDIDDPWYIEDDQPDLIQF